MWFQASRLGYIGIFFGVAVCVGYFAGDWLDKRFHTAPWLGLGGLIVGVLTGFRELWQVARRYQRSQNDNDGDDETHRSN